VTPKTSITVLFPDQDEPLASFERRIKDSTGEVLIIFSDLEPLILAQKDLRKRVLALCKKYSTRLRIATRSTLLSKVARAKGIRIVGSVQDLRKLLDGHPLLDDALREFLPHVWRQQLRSKLQSMGLLSLPKIRIWSLIILSSTLFLFVFFKLLPSATILVYPTDETLSQTANIFLAQSGSTADLPARVRVMDLIPIVVRVDHSITYDQISREFIGENAKAAMKVVNNSTEPYWLKEGTRLQNQAGMIFRLDESIKINPLDSMLVRAEAEPEDLYGEIVGKRGNIPAGLKWDFPGLTREERILVYAENTEKGEGGVTDYKTVLSKDDLKLGKAQLEQELFSLAKRIADERKDVANAESDESVLEMLYYEELTTVEYMGLELPDEFIGLPVKSIPISGSIEYTTYAYDTQQVLEMLSKELRSHVGEGRRLLEDSLTLDRLVAHVIDYEDDFSWIKLTVDLTGTQQYILDSLSPTGAVFAKKVRESVKGIHIEDAKRIVDNFPEVKKAEVSIWPPWSRYLPGIASHIVVEPIIE
jgi:hypothetical protein